MPIYNPIKAAPSYPSEMTLPSEVGSLALWLKGDGISGLADGDSVAQWSDASGMGNHATAAGTAPVFKTNIVNGRAVVRFDGTDKRLVTPSFLSSAYNAGMTLIVVSYKADTATRYTLSNGGTAFHHGGADYYKRLSWGGSYFEPIGLPELNPAAGFTAEGFRTDGTSISTFSNGRPIRYNYATGTGTAIGLSGALTIGGSGSGTGLWNGDIAEVMLFSSVLTDKEWFGLANYVAQTYGLNQKRQVVCVGDSLTYGSQGAGGYPRELYTALGSGWNIRNLGNPGVTLLQMLAVGTNGSVYDYAFDARARENVMIVWAGTNDNLSNPTAVTILDRLTTFCQARRKAGFKVVVVSMLPRGSNAPQEAVRISFNGLLRAGWQAFADAFYDAAADNRLGDSGDQNDTTYFNADATHLNQSGGYPIIAAGVRKAVDSITVKASYQSGTTAPATTPDFFGQEYYDTANNKVYRAFGTVSSASWIALN